MRRRVTVSKSLVANVTQTWEPSSKAVILGAFGVLPGASEVAIATFDAPAAAPVGSVPDEGFIFQIGDDGGTDSKVFSVETLQFPVFPGCTVYFQSSGSTFVSIIVEYE
jgi:hypothetical protein